MSATWLWRLCTAGEQKEISLDLWDFLVDMQKTMVFYMSWTKPNSISITWQGFDLLHKYQLRFVDNKKMNWTRSSRKRKWNVYYYALFLMHFYQTITAKAESYELLMKVNQHGKISTSALTLASKKACKKVRKMFCKFWMGRK